MLIIFLPLIGSGGPQPSPPRSPDLNPMYYFFCGYLKSLIYATPVVDESNLRDRIMNNSVISNTKGIFERVWQ